MRRANLNITTEQSLCLPGNCPLNMCSKKRYADECTHADGDADEKVQKVAPAPSRFAPDHVQHEPAHGQGSPWSELLGRMSSDSMRPSRRAMTRCIEVAMARSCVTSTRVVP